MSSKKITDADKLEIARLYRQSGDTTASLAIRYGVSNSTISRLLKTSIPEAEYEILIQQKRVSKVSSEEEDSADIAPSSIAPPTEIPSALDLNRQDPPQPNKLDPFVKSDPSGSMATEDLGESGAMPTSSSEDNSVSRRVRRRSSAPAGAELAAVASPVATAAKLEEPATLGTPVATELETTPMSDLVDIVATPAKTLTPPPISRTPVLRDILADSKDRYANPPPPPPVVVAIEELEEDNEPEDVNLLAAMFGEEIADGYDDEDDDADLEEEEESSSSYQQLDRDRLLTEDRLHVQLKPLSQATLPRTCYIVIDKFAELIVRPLKDFADLGQISSEETQQRTLPVFDNHRVAKRFSNQRTQRVIKVPDSRIFHKTTQHLRLKGITCLLVDGNIYSLN
jgi:hypothetical protein